MNRLEDIRRYYGVPANKGRRVRWIDRPHLEGRITYGSRRGAYVRVHIEGEKYPRECHPFDLDYHDGQEWLSGHKFRLAHDKRWDAFNARMNQSETRI